MLIIRSLYRFFSLGLIWLFLASAPLLGDGFLSLQDLFPAPVNVNQSYQNTLTATGGVPPYHFSLASGLNPPWVQVSDSGMLSYTPLSVGSYYISVRVTDSSPTPQIASGLVVLNVQGTVGPLFINTNSLPTATVGSDYSAPVSISGGLPPFSFGAVGLPPSLQINLGTGAVQGIPNASPGTYSFTYSVYDSSAPQKSASKTFSITISQGLFVNDYNFPQGLVNKPYSTQMIVPSGTAPLTFSVESGTVPQGLTLSSSGLLFGTPTLAAQSTFTYKVTDATGVSGSARAFITIQGASLSVSGTLPQVARYGEPITPVTLSGSGGVPPYTFTFQNLPPSSGINFDLATGILSGTPNQGGGFSLSLNVRDSQNSFGTFSASVPILDIEPHSLPEAFVGQPFSAPLNAVGFPSTATTSLSSGTLPPGLQITNGILTGTPTATGTYNFIVAAGTLPFRFSRSFAMTVQGALQPPLNVTPIQLNSMQVGQSFSQIIAASDGTPPYTLAMGAGTLPPGITLAPSGLVSGTPTGSGSYGFDANVTDSTGRTGTRAYSFFVSPPSLTLLPETIPDGIVGQPYSVSFSATGGTGNYQYSIGAVPLGINMVPGTNVLSGVPPLAGTFSVVVYVYSGGIQSSRTYSMKVTGGNGETLGLSPLSVPGGSVGIPYSQSIFVGAGTTSFDGSPAWSITAGSLPPGLSLDSSLPDRVTIRGTPTTAGPYSFTLRVRDASNHTGSVSLSIPIAGQPIQISPVALPNAIFGLPFSATLTATGGTPPYSFSAVQLNGDVFVPTWLASSGAIQVTPFTYGDASFFVTVRDANNITSQQAVSWTILQATLTIAPSQLPNPAYGQPYSASLTASGGTPPYQFFTSSGSLPAGLSLSSAGVISGSPTINGNASFTVGVSDANGALGSRSYPVFITGSPITTSPSTLADGNDKQPYSAKLTAQGGSPPYVFSLQQATGWPAGLSVNSDGTVSGTPTGGATNIAATVLVTDSKGVTGTGQFQLKILPSSQTSLTVIPALLPAATVGQLYAASFTAGGGLPPYVFSLPTVPLPAGLQLFSSGLISGTPIAAGSTNFNVKVQDANGASATATATIVVSASLITISPATLPTATFNAPYSVGLSATGGVGPYNWSLESGQLPPGLAIVNGALSGTPTFNGAQGFPFTLRATDQQGATGSRQYTLLTSPAGSVTITLIPDSLPNSTLGSLYSAQLSAIGGRAPYTFSVPPASTLPSGLLLSPGGILSGRPSFPGSYSFSLRAIDADGITGSRTYSLTVTSPQANPPIISSIQLPAAEQNVSFSVSLQASSGTPPYAWSISQGALPQGITLSPLGLISGIPLAAGTFAFSVTVTDSLGALDTLPLSLPVKAAAANTLFFDLPQLSFTLPSGAKSGPQCVSVFSTKSSVSAKVDIVDAGWASASVASVQTPGAVCLTVDAALLPAGSYAGALRFSSQQVQPTTAVFAVYLTVQAGLPPAIVPSPSLLRMSVPVGSPATGSFVMLSNSGSGPASFSVQSPSVSWLALPQRNGSVPANSSTALSILFTPSDLEPGVYRTDLIVSAPPQTITVPVELLVSPTPGRLLLSQTALEFLSWTGGAPVSASLGLSNQGSVSLLPSATALGGNWLQATLAGGSLAPSAVAPIQVRIDPQSLTPGRYTGSVTVSSPDAGNGPQVATIGLTVLSANSSLPADAPVSGLALTPLGPEGTIELTTAPGGALSFTTAISGAGTNWLSVTPSQGRVPAGGSLILTVSATPVATPPGLHSATLSIGFSDGTARTIPIEFYVPPSSASDFVLRSAIETCTAASPFVAHLLSPVPAFIARAGRPFPVRVQVENCDGTPASNIEITVLDGARSLSLQPEAPGRWSASWIPLSDGAGAQLSVAVSRVSSGERVTSLLSATGTIGPVSSSEPTITAAVGGANPRLNDPLVPGAWITLYGTNLSTASALASITPLPTSLADVQITLADQPLPLYYVSPTQINALVPVALLPGTRYQLVLRSGAAAAVPQSLTIADAQPGLFTTNQQGSGQAAAVLSGTRTLAAPSTPIYRGAALELYATGLGRVQNPPSDGNLASTTTLSPSLIPVTVTIGGRPATVLFSGLTPGAIGLYQINVVVPDDAPTGDGIPVVVTQKGAASNTATISIR